MLPKVIKDIHSKENTGLWVQVLNNDYHCNVHETMGKNALPTPKVVIFVLC